MNNDTYKLDFAEIQKQTEGQWISTLNKIVSGLDNAEKHHVEGKRNSNEACYCPIHTGKSGKAFRFLKDGDKTGGCGCFTCGTWPNGIEALKAIKNCSTYEAFEMVADAIGYQASDKKVKANVKKGPTKAEIERAQRERLRKDQFIANQVDKLWSESVLLTSSRAKAGRLYFQQRGISVLPESTVRFHGSVPYFSLNKETKRYEEIGRFPCLLQAMHTTDFTIHNLHKTYLTWDGQKANVPEVKLAMPKIECRPINGCANFINPSVRCRAIGVCEGLETGLAICEGVPGAPIASALNTSLMECFVIDHRQIDYVAIFEDFDPVVKQTGYRPGGRAAINLAQRLIAEREALYDSGAVVNELFVDIFTPKLDMGATGDWLNVLNEKGANDAGFMLAREKFAPYLKFNPVQSSANPITEGVL